MVRALLLSGLLGLVVACHAEPSATPRAVLDLRAAGIARPKAVGVTVDPAGRRFVFDEREGLYRLEPDGTAVRVRSLANLPTPDVAIEPPFTDLVAVGPDRFALTAIGDGFLLDLASEQLLQYFCYVPDALPDDLRQRTQALTFDPASDRLYAQPQTYAASDPTQRIQYTQIAAYDRATGVDVAWHDTPTDLDAGGMVFVNGRLFVGAGTRLMPFDLTTNQLGARDDLARFGVGAIEGLAHDAGADTLLVLDGVNQTVVELDRDQLAF